MALGVMRMTPSSLARPGDGAGAAGGGGADDYLDALGYKAVEGVDALGVGALIIGYDHLDLLAEDAARLIDLGDSELEALTHRVAVSREAAGHGSDEAYLQGIT